MSSTNKTTNYELTQFLATDVPSWLVDYNGDMSKIDTQMHANAVAADAAATAASTAGGKADTAVADVATLTAVLDTPNTGVLARMSSAENDIDTIQSLIGNGTPTTTDKTIIGAINELAAEIPSGGVAAADVSYDNTASHLAASNVQSAIDEVKSIIDNVTLGSFLEFKRQFSGKKIVAIGDSLSTGNDTWQKPFADLCAESNITFDNISAGSRTAAASLPYVQALTTQYDVAIIFLGANDAYNAVPIGNISTAGSYAKSMADIISTLHTLNDEMKIFVFGSSYSTQMTLDIAKCTYNYAAAAASVANFYGAVFKNLNHLANAASQNHTAQNSDGLHFTPEYSKTELFTTIVNKMLIPSSDEYHEVIRLKIADITAGTNVNLLFVQGYYEVGSHIHVRALVGVSQQLAQGATVLTLPYEADSNITQIMHAVNAGGVVWCTMSGAAFNTAAALPADNYLVDIDVPVKIANLHSFA